MKAWKVSLLGCLLTSICSSELVTLNVDLDELGPGVPARGANAELECTTLRFTQESAPQKLSDVHRSLTEALNRERTGSELKLEVEWTGDFKDRRPGEYLIMAKVGGKARCYRYLIQDVDECASEQAPALADPRRFDGGAIPQGKDWVHQCHSSAECLNKNGTYECQCPFIESIGRRSTPMPSKWPCEGKASTGECCDGAAEPFTHSKCKREFACHTSACLKANSCERVNGQCVDSFSASGYSCACEPGFAGNGHTCSGAHKKGFTVLEDDETGELTYVAAADQTIETDAARVCGCSKPIKKGHCRSSDCCGGEVPCNEECAADGHGCKCKVDFFNTTVRADAVTGRAVAWACADPTPPKVRLVDANGALLPVHAKTHVVRVRQFEAYVDFGYDVDDDNKDADMRKFEMKGEVPRGRLLQLGTHNVTFKTWTGPDAKPWSAHAVTREIQVVNANECRLPPGTLAACPECGPRCAPDAACLDEDGSYGCACPACGRTGDGFLPMEATDPLAPPSYRNGSGCTDSCAPAITLQGGAVTVFTVCKCDGPLCAAREAVDWDARVRTMLAKAPGEVCPPGVQFPCAVALDPTLNGKGHRDVTSRIVVGEPVHLSGLAWKIPLDVTDEAGNKAPTVFREIHVKELSIQEIEQQAVDQSKQVQVASTQEGAAPVVAKAPPPRRQSSGGVCPACVCPAAAPPPADRPCPAPSVPSSNEPLAWGVLSALLVALLLLVRCCIFLIPDDSSAPMPRPRASSSSYPPGSSRSTPQQLQSPADAVPAGFQYSPYPRHASPQAWTPRSPRPTPTGL